MDKNKKYFISLLKSHINQTTPANVDGVDWQAIYDLSIIHNVTAIIAVEIKKLNKEAKPNKEILTKFNQSLGYTIQNYEAKQQALNLLTSQLSTNKIRHLLVKGAAISDIYPYKELRTCGDIDVIVDNLDTATDLLSKVNFKQNKLDIVQHELSFNNQVIEIKNYIDHVMNLSDKYFVDLFNKNECYTFNGYTYFLNDNYHLAYILAHTYAHLKENGAGVRQLMDIHLLIKGRKIDLNEVLVICREIKCLTAAKALLFVTNDFFDTSITITNPLSTENYQLFTDIIINGGVFGFENGDKGTTRLTKAMMKKKDKSLFTSLKAFFSIFKVNKDNLQNSYKYAYTNPLLLPVAYFHRFIDALFKHTKISFKKLKSIFTTKDIAYSLSSVLSSLEDKK